MSRSTPNFWYAQSQQLREFLHAGGTSVILQISNRVIMLLLGVLLARQLGPTEYGYYAYAFAWLASCVVVADFGISQYTLRESARYQSTGDRAKLTDAVWHGIAAVVVMSLLIAGVGLYVLDLFAASPQLAVTTMVMFLLPATVLVRFATHALRGLGDINLGQSLDQIAVPVLVLGAIAGVVVSGIHLHAILAMRVQIIVAVVVAVLGLWLLWRRVGVSRIVPGRAAKLLPLALPFGLLAGINVLNGQIDILMLGYFEASDQVGFYRIAVLGAGLVGFGLQAANVVLPTLFARLQAVDQQEELQRLVTLSARLILASALPVAVVLWLWGQGLVGWIFGADYVDAYGPLATLAAGELIGASMGSLGFLLYMSGEERRALVVLGGTAVLNVALNLLLIPMFGMIGAATATAVGQGVRLLLLYLLVVRHLKLSPSPFHGVFRSTGSK